MALVTVITPGLLTTVQDLGRWGWQSRGVPVAGPMDPWSHQLANRLVGNEAGAATLELTLMGPELQFDHERIVAVAGADFPVTMNEQAVPLRAPFVVPSGGVLHFGRCRTGTRGYLAIAGGIDAPMVLGSRATHVPSGMGGLEGRALRAGDVIPLGIDTGRATVPLRFLRPMARTSSDVVRVIPGPQQNYFRASALDVLQSAPYRIDVNSNRMGFRLEGPALTHVRPASSISDSTPLGALQVPASGQPILLMADRQTTGGYPILATVISADMHIVGQLGPGDSVQFSVCTLAEAMSALIAQEQTLLAVDRGDRL